MNWLFRSVKVAQQANPLTMEFLLGLRETPQAETAASLLRMFNQLFAQLPGVLTLEPIITEVSVNDLDQEIFAAVRDNDELQFANWDETWKFLLQKDFAKSNVGDAIKRSLDVDGLTYSEEPGVNGPLVNGLSPKLTTNRWDERQLGSFQERLLLECNSLENQ
jgi:hypothetical protein